MSIVQLSPLRVGALAWQPEPGAWTLTVCVKATFELVPNGTARLAAVDEPIGPDRYDETGEPVLHAPADQVPFKPRADVLLVGHAYAPEGRPATELVARLTVGEYTKAIAVTGDRVWMRTAAGLRPSAPAPFVRMPLTPARAVRSPVNPVGVDPSAAPVEGVPALPNLEAVSVLGEGGLACFGPIAPAWPSRRARAGSAPEAWLAYAEGPAPAGFDFAYFNAAPRDQQLDLLRATPRIVLDGLHPEHAHFETTLPTLKPRVFLVASSGRASDVALRCDTLWIDTDRAVASLTWRGLASVTGPDPSAYGTIVVAAEGRGKELRARQIERLLREGGELTVERLDTLAEPDKLARRHDAVKVRGPEIASAARDGAPQGTSSPPAPPPARDAAVFDEPTPAPPEMADDLEETTTTGNERLTAPVLRTEPPPAIASSAPAIPFLSPLRASDIRALADSRTETPPGISTAPAPMGSADEGAMASDEGATGGAPGGDAVAPGERASSADADAPKAALVEELPSAGDAPHGVTLERYARLSVALAAPGAVRGAMLADAGLSPAQWAEVERTWSERVQSANEDGVAELSARLRAARAAAHEANAGPALSLTEYARVAVAVERGEVPRVLAQLKIGLPELMRLQRSWTQRSAEDPQLATALAEAMEAARWE